MYNLFLHFLAAHRRFFNPVLAIRPLYWSSKLLYCYTCI